MSAVENLPAPPDVSPPTPELPELRLTPQDGTAVVRVPYRTLRRSDLNPRRTFEEKPLFELAVDIYHKGLLQNLVVRPHPTEEGAYEIAAGERRWRAVGLLIEGLELVDDAGGESLVLKLPDDYEVPVLIRPLTDPELLELAITENLQREDVDPLDEADGFASLRGLGMRPDEIAARSGRSVKVVEQRLILAHGLGKEGRKLYRAGVITLPQAQVIAQTSGQLRQHLTKLVKENPHAYSAERLRKLTTEGRVLVSEALFDVEASGLAVVEDLWGVTPRYFRDTVQALARQMETIEAQAAQDRESGKWVFVDVVPATYSVQHLPWQTYQSHGPETLQGVVYVYQPQTGEVRRHEGVVRTEDAKAAQRAAQTAQRVKERAAKGPQELPIRDPAHLDGQRARARALWGTLATDHKRCLVLTVQGLFETGGEVKVRVMPAPEAGEPLPEIVDMVTRWTQEHPDLFISHTAGTMIPTVRGAAFHDALLALDVDALLELLAYHMHDQMHHWSFGSVTARPDALTRHVAQGTGADARLAREWQVSAEFLKAHTVPQLTALIEEMPAELRPSITPGLTKTEVVGRIVERGAALREAGWVPKIVQFAA